MNKVRCCKANDKRCPFARGGAVCSHWSPHEPIEREKCGEWTECVTRNEVVIKVRCVKTKS